jgi:hypothetical protein
MTKRKDRTEYQREYYRKKQGDRRRQQREKFKCSICGETRRKRSVIGDALGIHQVCDPAAWIAEIRKRKRKS